MFSNLYSQTFSSSKQLGVENWRPTLAACIHIKFSVCRHSVARVESRNRLPRLAATWYFPDWASLAAVTHQIRRHARRANFTFPLLFLSFPSGQVVPVPLSSQLHQIEVSLILWWFARTFFLYLHVLPLVPRDQYHIPMRNNILSLIKTEFYRRFAEIESGDTPRWIIPRRYRGGIHVRIRHIPGT